MFFAEVQIRVHLYDQPTDMRKSYDGLQTLARHAMGRDPLDGGPKQNTGNPTSTLLTAYAATTPSI